MVEAIELITFTNHGVAAPIVNDFLVIKRHTVEMNMDKIESVDVDQSLLGRLLNYGTIHVFGTGEGIESLRRIAAPLALRNAITAK